MREYYLIAVYVEVYISIATNDSIGSKVDHVFGG